MGGSNPTIVGTSGGPGAGSVALVIMLIVAIGFMIPSLRLFWRSLGSDKSQARKAVASAFCAVSAFAFTFVVAGMGNFALVAPLALVTVAFIGYGIPQVRRAARDMVIKARARMSHAGAPAQPPDAPQAHSHT